MQKNMLKDWLMRRATKGHKYTTLRECGRTASVAKSLYRETSLQSSTGMVHTKTVGEETTNPAVLKMPNNATDAVHPLKLRVHHILQARLDLKTWMDWCHGLSLKANKL